MTNNIIETIQKNLRYEPLHKIDPNIQDTKDAYVHSSVEKLGQAAIPAVATALYKFGRSDAGATMLISGGEKSDWLAIIYAGKENQAVEKVAQYAGVTTNQAESHMENIADEAVKITREAIGTAPTIDKVKEYLSSQRHHILVYLPAALQIGDVLNDDSLDDRTNKMEGPVSNFMHKIENVFAGGEKK
jgi:hypothetical protein